MRQYRSEWHREQAEKALEKWDLGEVHFLYEHCGWTQQKLAHACGVSQTTIHRLLKRAGIKARPDARGVQG